MLLPYTSGGGVTASLYSMLQAEVRFVGPRLESSQCNLTGYIVASGLELSEKVFEIKNIMYIMGSVSAEHH